MVGFTVISVLATLAFIQLGDGDGENDNIGTHNKHGRDVQSVNAPNPLILPGRSDVLNAPLRTGKRPKHPNGKKQIVVPLVTAAPTLPAGGKEVVTIDPAHHPAITKAAAAVAATVVAAQSGSNVGYIPPTILPQVKTVVSALQTSGATFNSGIDFEALYDNPIDWRNTYIITLKRDALRVEHCTNLTRDVWPGASLWWAIDGKEISDQQITDWRKEGYLAKRLAGFMNPKSKIGKPKISCLMSHARVWEQLAKEEDPNAFYFVLEDDVYATDGFNEHYANVVKELKGLDWDWVYLAIHPTFRRLNKMVIDGKNFINTAPRMVGNAGYLISRNGARRILKQMFPCSLPKDQALRVLVLNRTIDAYIVKTDLVGVLGQQGQGFKGSQKRDPTRIFKSNIWDK